MPQPNNISLTWTKDAALTIKLSGAWRLQRGLPSIDAVERELASKPRSQQLILDARDLTVWDSSVINFLANVSDLCSPRGIAIDRDGIPEGLCRLLDLAEADPEIEGTRKEVGHLPVVERIGVRTLTVYKSLLDMIHFLGEMAITFVQLLRMKARYRANDLFLLVRECGVHALPIATLISFLVGVILAFVGAVQLQRFGAQIYVHTLDGAPSRPPLRPQ